MFGQLEVGYMPPFGGGWDAGNILGGSIDPSILPPWYKSASVFYPGSPPFQIPGSAAGALGIPPISYPIGGYGPYIGVGPAPLTWSTPAASSPRVARTAAAAAPPAVASPGVGPAAAAGASSWIPIALARSEVRDGTV